MEDRPVNRDTEAPTFGIYCDDLHPENRYEVARFARLTEGWALLAAWRAAAKEGVSPRKRRQREDIFVGIDGRKRYNLMCAVCGFAVPVRDERLQPILDTAHTAGLHDLSLTALSARLRRSGAQ
jgi:hypothetical protein